MPKIVDHEQRRRELIESTWRVIARQGQSGATMRQIAQEAGYANGALKPYFPTKADLLEATYTHVYELTETRIDKATHGLRGLTALRALCLEVLPVSPHLLDEARIVVSFWDTAAQDHDRARLIAESLDRWHGRISRMLSETDSDGELRSGVDIESVTGAMLGFLQGSQVTAVMAPESFSHDRLRNQLESYLNLLRS
ncbi:HTH-type transcriptional regulator BetI [Corynebacterium atrinae]|uniref:TetR/AcrR family transcriptional regulator n=1 Tax=Corynebacterium atrinae TaxID=1336740 RepID=UPI0025B353FA|nr:TetR/AcrR family transcriptional regulator [Corynebacterium atrinae]WJY62313.1 HTH-type transcriptional regulator BetI [Corynebacterium atrinae]